MFCSKCGSALEDSARFCDKCGTPTNGAAPVANVEKKPDTEIQFTIKPKYKSIYFLWGMYVFIALLLIPALIASASSGEWIILDATAIFCAIILGIKFLSLLFKKKQLQCMRYDFYKTKVNYSDSFLNKAEKEVKYRHIRECVLTRTISDRIFGFGRIILFTNAETGYGNGILIPFVEDSENAYKQIKELLDD